MCDMIYLVVLSVLVLVSHSDCKKIKGQLLTSSKDAPFTDWAFLTRFCFLSEEGNFAFDFSYPEKLGVQQLLLYYDVIWEDGYSRGKNCTERRSILSSDLGQIIDLSPLHTSACVRFKRDDENWIRCNDSRYFRSARERWWFLVLANCGAESLLMEYNLHMTNGEDFLHREFSADLFYIFPIDMVFFFLHVILCVLSVWVAAKLVSCQLFHTTYKLYLASLWLYTFHLLLMSIEQGSLGRTGIENTGCKLTGYVVETISHIIFVLMLILVGKGYTITRGKISSTGTILITCFMVTYVLMYLGIFIWENVYFDEAYVLYRMESIPGYLAMGLRILVWVWFIVCIIFTVNHYPEKIKFYIPLGAFYSIWFLAGPVIMLISVTVMAKWTREKTVSAVENFVTLLANIAFMILTWPERANKMFPFHVKTTQIGVMISAPHQRPGEEGFPETNLPRNPFASSGADGEDGPNFTDLFVVSHSRSVDFGKPVSPYQRLPTLSATPSSLPPLTIANNNHLRQQESTFTQNPPAYADVVASAPNHNDSAK